MATKVKGLLKGLRYISQIFEEKEQDMQIGYPTDVKHVAHIGWDGPSANTPSWMREFESSREVSSMSLDSFGEAKLSSKDIKKTDAGIEESMLQHAKSAGTGTFANSPQWNFDAPKHSRRHHSTDVSSDSPSRDSSGSSRHTRRSRNMKLGNNDSPTPDLPAVPKYSRRRKSKGSSGGGSSKSQRPKDHISSPDIIPFTDMGSGSGSVQD